MRWSWLMVEWHPLSLDPFDAVVDVIWLFCGPSSPLVVITPDMFVCLSDPVHWLQDELVFVTCGACHLPIRYKHCTMAMLVHTVW